MATTDDHAAKEAAFIQGRDEMRSLLGEKGNQPGWDAAWQRGLTPWEGFLGNVAQPSLRWVVEKEKDTIALPPRGGRALVPGCGRGQDVLYLANVGYDALGLDISPTAVEAARTWLSAQKSDKDVARRAQVEQVDYFDLQSDKGPGRAERLTNVDLIYDYTFFCAIPASLHASWAAAHAAALRRDGLLICLVYPLKPDGSAITPDEAKQGPPYLVSREMLHALLKDTFALAFEGTAPDLPQHKQGRETIMVWRRR